MVHKLTALVDENAKEKVLQEHIATHLWLIDPSWDRISEQPKVERDMHSVINELKEKSNAEEKKGRVDIIYSKSYGRHIIIELKRFSVELSVGDLIKQIKKYSNAIQAQLAKLQREQEQVEFIILLGSHPTDCKNFTEANETLKTIGARIVSYSKLIDDAELAYKDYLESSREKARILDVIKDLEDFADSDLD